MFELEDSSSMEIYKYYHVKWAGGYTCRFTEGIRLQGNTQKITPNEIVITWIFLCHFTLGYLTVEVQEYFHRQKIDSWFIT